MPPEAQKKLYHQAAVAPVPPSGMLLLIYTIVIIRFNLQKKSIPHESLQYPNSPRNGSSTLA